MTKPKSQNHLTWLTATALVLLIFLSALSAPVGADEFEDGDDGSDIIYDLPNEWPDELSGQGSFVFSCGENSTFDGGNACVCNPGYIINTDRNACVSGISLCQEKYGPDTVFDAVRRKCGCAEGMVIGKNNQCVQPEKYCQENLGQSAKYDEENNSCTCATGFVFDGDTCALAEVIPQVKIKSQPARSSDQICRDTYGKNSVWNGTQSENKNYVACVCASGYTWNADATLCVVEQAKEKLFPEVADQTPAMPSSTEKLKWYKKFFNWIKRVMSPLIPHQDQPRS